ncbi:MAG: Acetyltransferase (GNAT) family protein [Chloroflexi bacterium]|nr:MAG: Acetyltransferase (GNAT) family protein [Chloroflexota bacterium]
MSGSSDGSSGAEWAEFESVGLVAAEAAELDTDGLRQAYIDGIERGFEGEPPALPEGVEHYSVRVEGETVGLLAVMRDYPSAGDSAVLAVTIDPASRGHASGTKALLAAERRLLRDGADRVLVRVPRTNGRGLYFMLRAGFTPSAGFDGADATWFVRGGEV